MVGRAKEDMMPSRRRAYVHAGLKPRTEDKEAAFAGRAPGRQYGRRTAILLRHANFGDVLEHSQLAGPYPG
jgi:hypothetical protein